MAARPTRAIHLHVDTDGNGPPVLLLPGFACPSEAWGVIVLRSLAARFFVLRPDWPGTGRSPPIAHDAPTIAALADAALAGSDAFIDAPVRLFGWGLGALVALQLAADRPERVERLVLLGGAADGAALLGRAATVAALCGVDEGASAEEHMLGFVNRLVRPAWRPFAAMFLPQLLPRPAATLAALRGQWAMLAGYNVRPRLPRIRAPTLVLVGAEDAFTPPALAEELRAGIPGARLRVIAEAGHAAIWEQPAAVLDAAIAFLGGAARADFQDGQAAMLSEGRVR